LWINMVERRFADLTNRQIRCGAHRSTAQLELAIEHYLGTHNEDPRPFVWTKTLDQTRPGCSTGMQRWFPTSAATSKAASRGRFKCGQSSGCSRRVMV
jgi:hypothetical protein